MSMKEQYRSEYKSLFFLSIAMIMGIVLFSALCLTVHFTSGNLMIDKIFHDIFFAIDFILGGGLIISGSIMYRNRVVVLKDSTMDSEGRMASMRAIVITHLAFCEMPAILSVISFLLFGDFLFFIIVGMSLFELFRRFPGTKRLDDVVDTNTFIEYISATDEPW